MNQNNFSENPKISVIILCYKEGLSVVPFINEMEELLQKRGLPYELILIANYLLKDIDTDQTPKIIKNLAETNKKIVVVSKPKEGMFGWDVKSGLEVARGDTVAFIDGDGQMPAKDVIRIYDEIVKNNCDMAQTFRVKRLDSLQRIFISKVYNFLLKILFPKISVFDANSKPKIFKKDALNKLNLKSDDWFIDAEIVIQATNLGFKVSQIPTVFLKNNNRASFVKLKTVFEFLFNLLRYRFTGVR